jgi:DUF4097 and DUF4098 domain-containing protein YvlB
MSSAPPNTPPGGGTPPPIPPYDPKTQWRVYREQQKAAWRAQRDAWKAQQHAWKAGGGGIYGPRVPSVVGPIILIGIGVVALLVLSGTIAASSFWSWYGRWWPLLLIGAGLALLGEWALDLRRETPVRRGGSFIGILILLALLGFSAAGWNHMGPWFAQWDDHGNDFFNIFGLPEHDNDQQALNAQIPANSAIEIENPRGDVSVTASDSPNIVVQAHEVAYANSDSEARNVFDSEAPHLTVSGSAVLVKSEGNNNGKLNLTVTVPKTAKVTVNAGRGDVTAAGLGAGITISAAHGDTHLNTIAGPIQMHFSSGKHDFSAHQVEGDLTIDGACNDLTISEVKGRVSLNGQPFGEVHMEDISGPVSVHTSITDVQIAELPGDLTFDSDNLRVTTAKGLVHVVTHSKDIDLSQIYGDSYVEDRDGRISVEPAGAYGVEAKNNKGDVEVSLPPNASATVDGRTRNGEIVSDFGLSINGDESKTISGRIGSGGSRISLSTQNGDLRIKKGPAFPPSPSAPATEAAPKVTAAPPNARHLKAPKALPKPPVTQ